MTAEEILERAAALVETAWAQGTDNIRTAGPYCAGTAFGAAVWHHDAYGEMIRAHSPLEFDRAVRAFHRQIGVGDGPGGIARWNDAPGRTQTEVATELRNAKRFLDPLTSLA